MTQLFVLGLTLLLVFVSNMVYQPDQTAFISTSEVSQLLSFR